MSEMEKTLMSFIQKIPDPRVVGRSKHKLEEVIALAICGVLSSCETWVDIEDWAIERKKWLKNIFELPGDIPSHDTFGRIFSIIDSEVLQEVFYDWIRSTLPNVKKKNIINIDGKFLNGTAKNNNSRTAMSLVTAWSSTFKVILSSEESRLEKNKGEKRAMQKLIEKLFLKDCIITLDAGGATPLIVGSIIKKKGDYIIGLKDNQRSLKKLCGKIFEEPKNHDKTEVFETSEKGHGRIENRKYEYISFNKTTAYGLKQISDRARAKWPSLKGFCKVTSTRTVRKRKTLEVRYYFTSLGSNIEEIGKAIRSHWSIENTVHWSLDVTFREDYSRVRIKHAATNLGVIRRIVLNMLKKENSINRSLRRKRKLCALNTDYMAKVIWDTCQF